MSFFEALNIEKKYGDFLALDDVSIHVPEGSLYGLLGPNGAGKTTLIRIINRITAPDSGSVLYRGNKIQRNDLQNIGYLPEERGLYKKMKVGEQALYLARLKGMSKSDALSGLKKWFDKFEMTHWWNKKIEELSKGMAQKVQFIITVLHEPKLLIFDEPFSGFDPVNANMLKKEVLELRKKGTTIIFSTHDMGSVEELCDHITLIDRSKTILEGKVSDLRRQFKENLFELKFSGKAEQLESSLNGNYEIAQMNRHESGNYSALIKLTSSEEENALLKKVIDKVQIHGFNEVLPTMNEVFIKAVGRNTKTESHE